MKKNKAGFTLIELLVVVLIIGILAAIAIPQYFKVVEKSRVSEPINTFSTIASAEERAVARNGTYTADFTLLDISLSNYAGTPCAPGAGTACQLKYYSYVISGVSSAGYIITATRVDGTQGAPSIPARYKNGYSLIYTMPGSLVTCGGGDKENCRTDLL